MVCYSYGFGRVVQLARHKGLKIPHIRNTVGSNPTTPTNFKVVSCVVYSIFIYMTLSWKILVVLSLLISGILFYQVNVLSRENASMSASIDDHALREMSLTKSYLQLRLDSKDDKKMIEMLTAVLLQALKDSNSYPTQHGGIVEANNE